MNRLVPVLLPELRSFSPAEQAQALKAARDTPLDMLELLGMAAGLVLVTALTRYALPSGDASTRAGAMVLNFVFALPLLALFLGPFHVRRLRRGLREQLQRRSLH
ncbi:MAG TPA: hypothetical protein VFU71_13310 [Burkholderiaceae bacterium]|nr:hypothetical protein [Burkholderiaceae bacterium]